MPSATLRLPRFTTASIALCLCLLAASFAFGQVQVLTEHNDVLRNGANTSETILTTANVSSQTFGKLFTQSVDGFVVGQPLYMAGVSFPDGSSHNVLYVATQHDSVFAFDGDSVQAPLWSTSFTNPAAGITTVPISDFGCGGTAFTEIGIVSTPVVDRVSGILYVVAKTLENGSYIFRLHALSVTTGADVVTPQVISASVATNSGTLQFNPALQMQRPALLLQNGAIYIGFGSNGCDTYAYHGWLLAYDATNLQQVAAFATTPNGTKGAIWQAGGGPAADADGTIFLATANGTFDANTGGSDYGDTVLHLSAGLTVLDYFTPYNQATLAANDIDLGSGGVALIPDQDAPHTHELVGGGKEGTLYVVDRDNMGGFNASGDTQIVQSIAQASSGELDSVPAYWNATVYIVGQSDQIKAFSLSHDRLSSQPTSQTSVTAIAPGSVSISSNGSSNGILWAIPQNNPAILYAFDAANLGTTLYSSNQVLARDKLGSVPKFVPPTVADGRVYVGGTSTVSVYGLLPLISTATGNNQSAYVGTALPVPLQVQASDAYQGNAIANVSVTCKDRGVGGTFSAAMPMLTDSQGQASTNYTLPKVGQNVTINCTSLGYTTATFSEDAIAGPATHDIMVSGNNQSGPVSTQLPAALVMQVLDPFGYGVPGITVTFSDGGAGGTFSSASVITDSLGKASALYTTPNNSGTVTVTASVSGLTPVKFLEVVTTTMQGFTLSAAPSTLSVGQGGSVPTTITVNPTGGFTGSVDLTASGLPSGVTAVFSATSTTSTSALTLMASSTATSGPATVTITGTSGALTQTTTITLTVVEGSYSLSAGPANPASIRAGGTATAPITLASANNYAGSVTLMCSIMPVVSPAPTCSVTSPVAVTSTKGAATLAFTTIGPSGAILNHPPSMLYAVWLLLPGLALIGFGSGPSNRKKLWGVALWIVLASLIVLPACGGSAQKTGGGSGTPAGTYTITITGKDANNLTQSNAAPVVSVIVN